ncbi:hypothetical protein Tco_0742744 [Tanacetum coccineum]
MIRVPVTIKIFIITNLHIIHRVSHNSLTVVRPLKPIPLVGIREPEGSDDYKEVPFDDEQILRHHNTAPVTPPALAYTPPPPVLATMKPLDTFLMGNKVISTIPERENDEFIKSSVDDLVPIPRESELTLDSTNLECSMPIDPPLPRTDVLGDAIVDINLPLGEHLDTLSTRDREVDFNPSRDIEELERLLADDPVPVPRVFDEPLGDWGERRWEYCFAPLNSRSGKDEGMETPSLCFQQGHHKPVMLAYSPTR